MTREWPPIRKVLGIPVHATTEEGVVALCHEALRRHQPVSIGVVNAAKIVNMRRESVLRESVLASDLIVADGMSVVWASRLLGQPLPARVNGTNLFEKLLALADREGYGVYLLGATPEVLSELLDRLRVRHPALRIVGSHHGFFADDEAERVALDVSRSGADLLFVGITSPKKEVFMARWGSTMKVGICHGVGGSFDVLAGRVRRAPVGWQRLGLEWLFRLLQEPGRLWRRYLTTNTIFTWWVIKAWLLRSVGRRPQREGDGANDEP
jgi:N-acetylglucosaminyldiphosphoundecaprenol N-acetyl-beta-D-mannosaminyltransferase